MKHLTSEQRYVISALKKRGETLGKIGITPEVKPIIK